MKVFSFISDTFRLLLRLLQGMNTNNKEQHTAISRKVVGKSARDNPEKYCGWF